MYDKGWYSITDIVGEEKNIIYKSRNAQEAYLKWNIYIGRKRNASHLRRGRGSVKSAMRKRENKTESTTGYRRELWAFST